MFKSANAITMSRSILSTLLFVALAVSANTSAIAQSSPAAKAKPAYLNIGRNATPAEVAAWDIDVRPDFKGLPAGSGSVAKGQDLWEKQCASCHGTFGESNEVFTPIAGGTTKDDIKTGKVASLMSDKQPQRTTLMKVATISTLWDYIYRAMPGMHHAHYRPMIPMHWWRSFLIWVKWCPMTLCSPIKIWWQLRHSCPTEMA
jgi:cytochrome c